MTPKGNQNSSASKAAVESGAHDAHPNHSHVHGPNCGHLAVNHDGHVDYLHDGHLHHTEKGAVREHAIGESATNRAECTPDHDCHGHEKGHRHGPGCGHAIVPHGTHVDYLVDGHLHHPHGSHCDNHGTLSTA